MTRAAYLLRSFLIPLTALVLAACAGDVPEQAGDDAQPAEVMAAAVFDPALFDSIAWPGPRDAVGRGATVYAYSCAKCHGDRGAGNGGYQLQGRVLRPPSFRTPDWRFADDIEGLREAIHAGNDRGMPHWGDAGLAARDIDAVSRYIMYGLRADVY